MAGKGGSYHLQPSVSHQRHIIIINSQARRRHHPTEPKSIYLQLRKSRLGQHLAREKKELYPIDSRILKAWEDTIHRAVVLSEELGVRLRG